MDYGFVDAVRLDQSVQAVVEVAAPHQGAEIVGGGDEAEILRQVAGFEHHEPISARPVFDRRTLEYAGQEQHGAGRRDEIVAIAEGFAQGGGLDIFRQDGGTLGDGTVMNEAWRNAGNIDQEGVELDRIQAAARGIGAKPHLQVGKHRYRGGTRDPGAVKENVRQILEPDRLSGE